MPIITLTQPHRHGGHDYEAGDCIEVDDATAALLVSVGKVAPDKGEAAQVTTPGDAPPQLKIPKKKRESLAHSPTTEAID